MTPHLVPLPLGQLIGAADGTALSWPKGPPPASCLIGGLAYDSRKVRPGDAFFAWSGRAHDGHDHIEAACRAGARVVFSAQATQAHIPVPQGLHPDPKGLLTRMARALYSDPAKTMTLVAITGTNGKTTTAHVMASILAAHHKAAGLLGTLGPAVARARPQQPGGSVSTAPSPLHYGADAGLTTPEAPDLLAQLRQWQDAGICAVALEASSIALVEGRLDATPVDVAVMTNLSHDHLDYHGDMDRYLAAKGRLFSACRKNDGVCVLPWSWRDAPQLACGRVLTYSAEPTEVAHGAAGATVQLNHVAVQSYGTELKIRTPQGVMELTTPLVGSFNVENVLAAVTAALALSIPQAAIEQGTAAMAPVPGRLERVDAADGAQPAVWVDFAHTPDALTRVLGALRNLGPGRLHVVFGCGGDRDAPKRPAMGAAAAAADSIWITNDNPRSEEPEAIAAAIAAGALGAGVTADRLHIELDRSLAIRAAVMLATANDRIVIAGKGHEPYQLARGVKVPFDDREQARAALNLWRARAGV